MFWSKMPKVNLSEEERISIWMDGFKSGVTKSWDLMTPLMASSLETMKKKMREDAATEAINRLHGKS